MLTRNEDVSSLVAIHGLDSIAFTMDRNRTWAQSFGLEPLLGHTKGRDVAESIIDECFRLNIRYPIVWAMSESNTLKRSKTERDHLAKLLKEKLRQQEEKNEPYGFHLCGRWQKAINDPELEELVARAHERTAKYKDKVLTVLFGYRGITDLKQAAARLCEAMGPEAIENEDMLRRFMWVGHLPERISMMVRTGVNPKNRHNSDSLLPLHGEQAFIYDVEVPWPEFTIEHLHQGIRDFAACKRAKGA